MKVLHAMVVVLALGGCDASDPATRPPVAETLYVNANVITVNDAEPRAEAVAVRDGRILAVGSREVIELHKGPATVVEDLGGRTLVPGFVDGHGHMGPVGIMAMTADLLPPPDGTVTSVAGLTQALRNWAAGPTAADFGVIVGMGYDDSQLEERRHPTRRDLDAVSLDTPVYVVHQSGHLGVANSAALEMLGIDSDTEDPEGGVIRRESGSRVPDGVLEENAHMMAMGRLLLGRLDAAQVLDAIEAGQRRYASFGYTTAQDGGSMPETVAGYEAAAEQGRLFIDVVSYVMAPSIRPSDTFMEGPYHGRDYRNHYRIGGIKLMLDGSPQGKTAWLTEPYFEPPAGQPRSYRGYPNMPDEKLAAYVENAFANGWQVLAHVNGDAAVDQLLNAIDQVGKRHPDPNRRTVAIHAQTVRADQLDRMRALSVMPSFFAAHTFYWGDWHRDSVLGEVRAANISPTRWALDRGMRFSTHHDAPVIPPNSMRVMWATVNRVTRSGTVLGPDQRVPPEVVLKAMTLWPAWQHHEEDRKGSIEPGKLADLVVLSEDPLAVEPMHIEDIRVERTIKSGREIYRAPMPPAEQDAEGGA